MSYGRSLYREFKLPNGISFTPQKVAVRKPNKSIKQAVERLEKLGFKRYLLASVEANKEKTERVKRKRN